MIKINEHRGENIVETLVSEKLVKNDYDQLIPLLEDKINRFGKLRWLWQMENFDGWSGKAFWADSKFDLNHADDFEKVAVVGEKKWHDLMAQAMKPFTSADVRYFDNKDLSEAKSWLNK
ncbi:MAG: STAS/SEC14 domain-containing protein [Candidatus Cyclobacteriaceae bacterium M3_2C_046]